MRLEDVEDVLAQPDAEGHEEVGEVLEAHLLAVGDRARPERLHGRLLLHDRLRGHQGAEVEGGWDDQGASLKNWRRNGAC